jgi:hypothetical protein
MAPNDIPTLARRATDRATGCATGASVPEITIIDAGGTNGLVNRWLGVPIEGRKDVHPNLRINSPIQAAFRA